MNASQYFTVVAVIYVAPTLPRWFGRIAAAAMLAAAIASDLEWL